MSTDALPDPNIEPNITFLKNENRAIRQMFAALPAGQRGCFRCETGAKNLRKNKNSLFAPASL